MAFQERPRALQHPGLLDQDAPGTGAALEHGRQQGTGPAGDVGDLSKRWRPQWTTVVTLPYGVLVGVLLYLDLRARKENLNVERLRADLQASAA